MGQIWHNKIPIKLTNKVYLYNTFGGPKIWTKKSYKKYSPNYTYTTMVVYVATYCVRVQLLLHNLYTCAGADERSSCLLC